MDWSAFISTTVGAGVSIVTSLFVFSFTSWREAKRNEKAKKRQDAFLAFQGFQKLVQIANDLENTSLHIDQAFAEAEKVGMSEADPFQKIQPLVRARVVLEPIRIEETYFLVSMKSSSLLSKIELIYRRALNIDAVVEQFNAMKAEFSGFIEARAKLIEPGEGTKSTVELSLEDAKLAHLKGGAMNNLIGQLLEYLERDRKDSRRIAESFLQAAKDHFEDDFPKVNLEWESAHAHP